MDGAAESSTDTGSEVQVKKMHYVGSSYTQCSRGGFHDDIGSSTSIQNVRSITSEELAAFYQVPPPTPVSGEQQSNASLPTRKDASPFLPGDWNPYTRRYVSAMPNLPALRRVTPFSRQEYSSFEEKPDRDVDKSQLIMPSPLMVAASAGYQSGANASGIDINDTLGESSILDGVGRGERESSGDTVSISSWRYDDPYDIDDLNSRLYSTSFAASTMAKIHDGHVHVPSTAVKPTTESSPPVPYEGFPPELLDQPKENQVLDFASQTLPRMSFPGGLEASTDKHSCHTPAREDSFDDDRAMLPSQNRAMNSSTGLRGMRSTSFWF